MQKKTLMIPLLLAIVSGLGACGGEGKGPGACVYDNDSGRYCKETIDADKDSDIKDCVGDPSPTRVDDGTCVDEGFIVECDWEGLFSMWAEDEAACETL